jgi:transcriptional regulator with XRE-family HTH domain
MRVQKLRLQHGWSQQQLADLSGLSVRTIQRIERGQPASTETLKSLASVFEIDFTQLQEASMPLQEPQDPTDPARTPVPPPLDARSHEELLAMRHVEKLRRFYRGVALYVVVITGLTVLNALTRPHHWWVVWPALGWGIGLLARAAATFDWLPFFGADWERRQIEKRLGRPLS